MAVIALILVEFQSGH